MSRVRLALGMTILAVPMLAMSPPPAPTDTPVRQDRLGWWFSW